MVIAEPNQALGRLHGASNRCLHRRYPSAAVSRLGKRNFSWICLFVCVGTTCFVGDVGYTWAPPELLKGHSFRIPQPVSGSSPRPVTNPVHSMLLFTARLKPLHFMSHDLMWKTTPLECTLIVPPCKDFLLKYLTGGKQLISPTALSLVDVRDVAEAHIRCMEHEDAEGRPFSFLPIPTPMSFTPSTLATRPTCHALGPESKHF